MKRPTLTIKKVKDLLASSGATDMMRPVDMNMCPEADMATVLLVSTNHIPWEAVVGLEGDKAKLLEIKLLAPYEKPEDRFKRIREVR
jgi:hypothetical protein